MFILKLPVSIYGDEQYYCHHCEVPCKIENVRRTWKCAICGTPVTIKISMPDYVHSGHRLKPEDLEVDMLVTLERKHMHRVLAVRQEGDIYRIALEKYKVICVSKDTFIVTIDGIWVDRGPSI